MTQINLKNITVVIPVYNGETTIVDTIHSISNQKDVFGPESEIIVVNDGSTDQTLKVLENINQIKNKIQVKIISLKQNMGLSHVCNLGVNSAKNNLVAIIQCDILFAKDDSLMKLIEPLERGSLATYPYVLHPLEVWKKFSFWQKAMFDRLVGERSESKFAKCVVTRKDLIQQVGGYNEEITGADDKDMFEKINRLGLTTLVDTDVIHIHSNEANFPVYKLYDKEAQEAEATGVSVRMYGVNSFRESVLVLIRPIIALSLFIPILWPFLFFFIYFYTKNLYKYERKDKKIFQLPFVTLARIYIYSYYLFKGFLTKRTSVRHFTK